MKPLPLAVLTLAALLAAGGCCGGCSGCGSNGGNGGNGVTPRRTAYPRIDPYPEAYREASPTLPIVVMVNDSAHVEVAPRAAGAAWVNAAYPRYWGATLRLSVGRLRGNALRQALANRRERMALNAGGLSTVATELTAPSGFTTLILSTPYAPVTPLQILATDSATLLLAGALELPPAPGQAQPDPELYAPVVAAVERDLIFMAKHLHAR